MFGDKLKGDQLTVELVIQQTICSNFLKGACWPFDVNITVTYVQRCILKPFELAQSAQTNHVIFLIKRI